MFWALLLLQALPDSAAKAQVHTQIQAVADSLLAFSSAAAHFRQDLAKASDALVMARAKRVRTSCQNSLAPIDSLATRLRARRYTPARDDAEQRAAYTDLVTVRRALASCQLEWGTTGSHVRADSLRAWGPFRLTNLDRLVRRYEQSVARFRGYVAPPDTIQLR